MEKTPLDQLTEQLPVTAPWLDATTEVACPECGQRYVWRNAGGYARTAFCQSRCLETALARAGAAAIFTMPSLPSRLPQWVTGRKP